MDQEFVKPIRNLRKDIENMISDKLSLLFSSPGKFKIVPDILLVNMMILNMNAMIREGGVDISSMECSPPIQGVAIGTSIFYFVFRIIVLIFNIMRIRKKSSFE